MPVEPPASFTADKSLLSLCPRQVLLRHQSPMGKTKSSGGSADAPKTAVDENIDLLLRQSFAAYLNKFGYSATLSTFLSEAKVPDWKTHSLDLKLILDKHLKSSGFTSENIYSKTSKQELDNAVIDESKKSHNSREKQKNVETNVVKDGQGVTDLHVISGEKKKKKSKLCSEIADGAQQGNLQMNYGIVGEKDNEKSKGKLTEKQMKSLELDPNENDMKVSKYDIQTIEVKDGELLKEKGGPQKSKMKKKHKLHAVDDVLNSEKGYLLVDEKNKEEAKLGETQLKSKDKKHKRKTDTGADDDSVLHSRDHKNESQVVLDETVGKSKDKKKKRKKLLDDSAMNIHEENGVEIKESKKRKRLSVELMDAEIESNDVKVTEKVTLDEKEETKLVSNAKDSVSGADPNPNKKIKTKKNEEGSPIANGTASDLNRKEKQSKDDGALVAGASAGKNENNGYTQKSTKKDHKGSAEPKTGNHFCRIKVDSVTFADERLQDNSYWAKHGADTGYGAKAQEVLGQVRGRDFRHEKTKKKRGSYRGGQIDFNSHSVKFNYSDGE